MATDNATTLVGNLTRDPELSFTPSGMAICKFGLAVNRRWQKDGEWEEKVSFFDCVVWGRMGENVAESLQKGVRAIVHGRLDMQSWEDKETGKARNKIELIVESIGPELKWATTPVVERNEREGGGGFADRQPDFDPGPAQQRRAPARAAAGPPPDEEPF